MRNYSHIHCIALLLVVNVRADDLQQSSWRTPTLQQVREQATSWLHEKQIPSEQQAVLLAKFENIEEATSSDDLLSGVVELIAHVEPRAAEIQEFCRQSPPETGPQSFAILNDDTQSAWLVRQLRLYYGAWLARHQLFDEAAEQLASLKPDDVIAPASLLFHQAVAAHRLLQKKECLVYLTRLLENESELPQRYLTVAKLMQHDLKTFEPESLDEISRLMDDVRRRLDLGRAGSKVREEEAAIIAKLDKKIKDLEEQRKKQQQQQQASGKAQQSDPGNPAQESMAPRDLHASDETDPKRFNKANQWGNLPPKQRQQALQQIGRDLPAHYRDTIEEYYKRLAQDGNE